MDKKNILISAGVALLVVVISFVYFGRSTTTIVEKGIVEKIIEKVKEETFGAIPGTSVEGNVFTIGGVDNYFFEGAMTSASLNGGTATGTVCAFKLPVASTTLVDYSARFITNAPTTTAAFAVYNTIGGYGTSTTKAIGGIIGTIAANGRLFSTSTQATTTAPSAATGMILRGSNGGEDNSFLIFDLQGGSSPFTGTGICRAQLREL